MLFGRRRLKTEIGPAPAGRTGHSSGTVPFLVHEQYKVYRRNEFITLEARLPRAMMKKEIP